MKQVSHITQAGLELTMYPGLAQTSDNPLVLAASVLRLQSELLPGSSSELLNAVQNLPKSHSDIMDTRKNR